MKKYQLHYGRITAQLGVWFHCLPPPHPPVRRVVSLKLTTFPFITTTVCCQKNYTALARPKTWLKIVGTLYLMTICINCSHWITVALRAADSSGDVEEPRAAPVTPIPFNVRQAVASAKQRVAVLVQTTRVTWAHWKRGGKNHWNWGWNGNLSRDSICMKKKIAIIQSYNGTIGMYNKKEKCTVEKIKCWCLCVCSKQ